MVNSNLDYQVIEALDGMNRKFDQPYVIFFPAISKDGHPFPVNKYVKTLQGTYLQADFAWRGDLVVVKYADLTYSAMIDISMADFPLVKNYLSTHGCTQHRM